MALLKKNQIEQAFRRLGELALAQGNTVELLAGGGVVMVLVYNARLATQDVDAIVIDVIVHRYPFTVDRKNPSSLCDLALYAGSRFTVQSSRFYLELWTWNLEPQKYVVSFGHCCCCETTFSVNGERLLGDNIW